jgi:putative aldouronate transport system permease protein
MVKYSSTAGGKMKNRLRLNEKVFMSIVYFIVFITVVVTLYPMIFIFVMSFSDLDTILKSGIIIIPGKLYLGSYQIIFNDSVIWRSYYNTIWYTVVGTVLNVFFTISTAYVITRKKFIARKIITKMFLFTMLFSGGMIPSFLVIYNMGMYNSRLSMVIPGLVGVWYLIISKTYIQSSIHEELVEAFKIEKGSEFVLLFKIIIPLCKPIIATLVVFYAISHWNAFFNALIYLKDEKLQPLQVYLRKILQGAANSLADGSDFAPTTGDVLRQLLYMQIKYAVIIVALLPILCVYPLVQKYFVKGMMLGAIKG